jgi:hypothetical protein
MNAALIIQWRRELAEALQAGRLTETEGIEAMRELDRMDEHYGSLLEDTPPEEKKAA